jgi:tryptophan-rich sensory protein
VNNTGKVIISLALPLAAGAIAGAVTTPEIDEWYSQLNQPGFNPPNWVFAPVWTMLYILMGISCYLIWKIPKNKQRDNALKIYGFQLLLNFTWSFLFFYTHQIDLAMLEIIFLWMCIILMIGRFYSVNKAAAYLNIPYLLWVTFASALNISYYILNE